MRDIEGFLRLRHRHLLFHHQHIKDPPYLLITNMLQHLGIITLGQGQPD
jgi:hypothetical protein